MGLQYKTDIIQALKEKGYNTTRIRKEKLLSESTLQKLRKNQGVAWENLERICMLLDCDISNVIEYKKD